MEPKPNRRRFIGIAAAAGAAAAMPVMASEAGLRIWNGTALGAQASLRLYHPQKAVAEEAIARCVNEIVRLEHVFSLYRPDSALTALNRDGEFFAPPLDLIRLLGAARRVNRMTDGVFDITVQPLWRVHADHFASDQTGTSGPTDKAIAEALARVGQDNIRYTAQRVSFARPGVEVTPNGIAQGYITDRIAELLHETGFENVLIDLGETRAMGRHADGTPWRAALADPGGGPALRTVELENCALATSAPGGFSFDPEGRFHHIFDPRTGQPAEAHASVSVVARNATMADALSTAFVQMSAADIRQVLEGQPGLTVYLLDRDGRSEKITSPVT